jgi:hypothetical protein
MGRRGAVLIVMAGLLVASAVALAIAARPKPLELPAVRTSWGVPPTLLLPPAPPAAPGQPDVVFQRRLRGLFDSEAFDVVRNADRMETRAIRDLVSEPDPKLRATPSDLHASFAILPRATPVSPEIAREITRVVLDPAIYSDGIRGCLFQPGVAIRFWKGSRAVDAIVCFHCGDLAFQPVGESPTILGQTIFEKQELLDLVRRARSTDTRLAHLK